jgi:hypothetical protein
MSHPGAISRRCNLRISRRRRRIRLRLTAFPSVFLTLQPKRLSSRPLRRRKTVNSELARRRPARYTKSYSARRSKRQARGNPARHGLDARKAVTPFPTALGKDFPSSRTLHACAKAVLLMTAPHMRLIRPLRQRSFSSAMSTKSPSASGCRRRLTGHAPRENRWP